MPRRTPVFAARLQVLGLDIQAFSAFCHQAAVAISGYARRMSTRARRDGQRQSAQAEVLEKLHDLHQRRHRLLIEKEIVAAERKAAVREHKAVSGFDRRLRAINAELLRIG